VVDDIDQQADDRHRTNKGEKHSHTCIVSGKRIYAYVQHGCDTEESQKENQPISHKQCGVLVMTKQK